MTERLRHRARSRQVSRQEIDTPDPPLTAAEVSSTSRIPPPPAPAPAPAFPDPIPDVIAFGSLTMFAGPPGAGKTTLLVDWFRRWLHGEPICGKPTNPPTALGLLIADRQATGSRKWLDAVGLGDQVKVYCIADDPSFPINDLKVSTKVIDIFNRSVDQLQLPPGALLVVDPITPLFVVGRPNEQRDVALSMLHYSRISRQRQLTMVFTGHFSKQPGKKEDRYARPQDRIAGSVSFVGYTDTQVYLIPPESDQPAHELGWVPRHAPEEKFYFTRGADGLFIPYDDVQGLAEQEVRENAQCVAAILASVPLEPEMIPFKEVVDLIMTTIGLRRVRIFFYRNWLIEKEMLLVPKRGYVSRPAPPEGGDTVN